MKKIIASAVGLMLAGGVAATTASAVESQFGGYWRTRAYVQDDFSGSDNASYGVVDTRTRLYYTAKFSDDLKFVNKFEWNSAWGDNVGGDLGTDGMGIFRIKHSYVDANFGNVRAVIGMQGAVVARGFYYDDDFAGVKLVADMGTVKIPVVYAWIDNEDVVASDAGDAHFLTALPTIAINDMITVTPHASWYTQTQTDNDLYWLGVDVDVKMDAVSIWGTAIYNGGEVDDVDVQAFLLAAGADAGIVHGQAFYASGDDSDADQNGFQHASPWHTWSEIMGRGTFDNTASNGAPGHAITNIWAANAGVTVAPMDKMKVSFDVWYAELAEEVGGEDELGLELDGKVSYKLLDNLNVDFVLAYLVAGDATGSEDPMEAGVRLSLSF